jgi:pilus assembly protein Flp/PilA
MALTRLRDSARAFLQRFLHHRSGATAIEYALIAGLVGMAIIVGVTALGSTLDTDYFSTFAGYFKG